MSFPKGSKLPLDPEVLFRSLFLASLTEQRASSSVPPGKLVTWVTQEVYWTSTVLSKVWMGGIPFSQLLLLVSTRVVVPLEMAEKVKV